MLLKSASMTSSGTETILFSGCIRDTFSVLGVRTPRMSMKLSFNEFAVFCSMEVSIMSPLSFCAFPSENMTTILNNADDLFNEDKKKH